MRQPDAKSRFSLVRILEMNLGFLGLQFSFGLQQGNMAPIYSYLGADEARLPLMLLAGPLTGLLVQPVVGALSDRTSSPLGRRTPYFLAGAVMCSAGLFLMPLSGSILIAVLLLWLLDAGNNTTMEPYRAFVSDLLAPEQRSLGFLTQSAFTGLAQMLAFLTPSLLVWAGMNQDRVDAHHIPYTTRAVFMIGAALSIATILWSVLRVREPPLSAAERARVAAQSRSPGAILAEIGAAIRDMPPAMRQLGWVCLFQWYAMAAYWSYVIYAIGRSVYGTSDPLSSGFHSAVLANGEMSALFNGVAFLAAFAMLPLARRFGAARVHAVCLTLAGLGMLALPHVREKAWLFAPAVGVGVGWASIMGNPYTLLADAIPPERTGVYMGVFNMMIVVPMLLLAATLPFAYRPLLGGDPGRVLTLSGALMIAGAVAALAVRTPRGVPSPVA